MTLTATVKVNPPGSGTATGNVMFVDQNGNVIGTGTLNNGTATLTTTSLPVGKISFTAVYSRDNSLSASTSLAFTQTIEKRLTQTTVISPMNPSVFGKPVAFLVTVVAISGSGIPTGTVTLSRATPNGTVIIGTALLSSLGTAVFTASDLPWVTIPSQRTTVGTVIS